MEDLYRRNRALLAEGDVMLASFPRAGNTWIRMCLADIVCGGKGAYGRVIPSLDRYAFGETDSANPLPFRIVKTHRLDDLGDRRFVYILRDPVDLLRSYYRFRTRREEIDADVFAAFAEENAPRLARHVARAAGMHAPGRSVFVRYENMHRNGTGELSAILEFLGVPAASRLIGEVLARRTVTVARQRLAARGHPRPATIYGEGRIGLGRALIPSDTRQRIDETTAEAYRSALPLADVVA